MTATATRTAMVSGEELAALDGVAVRLGERVVWSQASLTLRPGTLTAVLGPNGSGKSTLLRLLLGLVPVAQGSVRVLGRPPHRGNADIGYVPQRRTLDPDLPVCGRDLVSLGADGHRWGFRLPNRRARRRRDAVRAAISAVGADAYADRAIGQLSGGEQQRLLVAQAMVSSPRLLFLDEPLSSLDIRNQVAMAHLVAELGHERQLGVLMVTHDINPILPVVDQVVYIARGRVAVGVAAEVITTETLSRLYDAPVEVVQDRQGRIFVVGLENETAHPHEHGHAADSYGERL